MWRQVLVRLPNFLRVNMIKASGPLISATPEIDINALFDSYYLDALKPKVMPYPDRLGVIPTTDPLPNPHDASSTAPEVIEFSFVVPGVEPTLSFMDYIRGAACTSMMLPQEYHQAVIAALGEVANRVVNFGELPPLNEKFNMYIETNIRSIFTNNEPNSWQGLLAFMQGSYWLLGYIERPTEKRLKGNKLSPLDFVDSMITHFAQLGFVPR